MAKNLYEELERARIEQEDQCGDGGTMEECETPMTALRSKGQNASVREPYQLPAGAMWGEEHTFRFTAAADLNTRIRVELLTHMKETALGLRQGSLRPVIRYARWAARTGSSMAGAFAPIPISLAYVNQAAAGAADLFNTDIAPVFGSVASTFGFLEGPGRLGFGAPENGDGWYDFRIIVLSTLTPGVTGNVGVRLGWELKPAGAAAP